MKSQKPEQNPNINTKVSHDEYCATLKKIKKDD